MISRFEYLGSTGIQADCFLFLPLWVATRAERTLGGPQLAAASQKLSHPTSPGAKAAPEKLRQQVFELGSCIACDEVHARAGRIIHSPALQPSNGASRDQLVIQAAQPSPHRLGGGLGQGRSSEEESVFGELPRVRLGRQQHAFPKASRQLMTLELRDRGDAAEKPVGPSKSLFSGKPETHLQPFFSANRRMHGDFQAFGETTSAGWIPLSSEERGAGKEEKVSELDC
ncbi:uncharacterized protein VTP21DRAFT_4161 [Calcarisporiella thermophila]|uniref:uncharacterized protein n=1 Tax=Calcarisporiella thermophila TaxID=911321 RepID=UPI003743EA19